MQELSYNQIPQHRYDDIVKAVQEKYPDVAGVPVDVSPVADGIQLTIGKNQLYYQDHRLTDMYGQRRTNYIL
jgi:hypothetical protein